jgi:hypothetical protein
VKAPAVIIDKWIFFYFSYSRGMATGFSLYSEGPGDATVEKANFKVMHHKMKYMQFIFGGKFVCF